MSSLDDSQTSSVSPKSEDPNFPRPFDDKSKGNFGECRICGDIATGKQNFLC